MQENRVNQWNVPANKADIKDAKKEQIVSFPFRLTLLSIMLITLIAEIVTMFVSIVPGVILYGVILIALANLSYFTSSPVGRRIFLALTLLPILRILSLAMPVQLVTLPFRYVMIGIPLLISTVLVIRYIGLPTLIRKLSWSQWMLQLILGISGIPLGVIAFMTLNAPPDVFIIRNWALIAFQVIALTIFGAILEEVIFRGLIQKALAYSFGNYSIILTSVLYTIMLLGMHSPGFIIFYGVSGLLFSIWVQYTDSIWGSIMAHSLMNIVFLLFFYLH